MGAYGHDPNFTKEGTREESRSSQQLAPSKKAPTSSAGSLSQHRWPVESPFDGISHGGKTANTVRTVSERSVNMGRKWTTVPAKTVSSFSP